MGSFEYRTYSAFDRVLFPCNQYKSRYDNQARSSFHEGRSFCLLLAYSSTCYKASKMPFLFHILLPLRFRSVPEGDSRRGGEPRENSHPRRYISSRIQNRCNCFPYLTVFGFINKAIRRDEAE